MKNISVVAAIIIKDNKVFATQRGYGEFKDWWEFSGGKIEAGETPEQALKREIEEELDTVISVDKYITTVDYDYPSFHLNMRCYICHVIKGKLDLLEAEQAKWLTKKDINSVNWLPADKIIIPDILKDL